MIFVLHHGVTVADIDRAIDWYGAVLGTTVVHRQRQDNDYTRELLAVPGAVLEVAQLALPGRVDTRSTHDIELIQYVSGDQPADEALINRPGQSHLAFVVDDIDAVADRVIASGGRLRNPPVTVSAGVHSGSRVCYLHDPDGNTVELLQRA